MTPNLKIAVANGDDPDAEQLANGGALPGADAKLVGPTYAEWLSADGA